MTEYTTTQQVSNYLQRDLTDSEVSFLQISIPAIGKWIDTYLNTTFQDVSPTTRYYDGCAGNLDIDPCQSITAVGLIDSYTGITSAYASTDYSAFPINEDVKNELRSLYGKFPHGIGNIYVTATFTEYDDGVPEDIQHVATMIAANLLQAGKNSEGIAKESLEGHSVEYATEGIDKIATQDPVILDMLGSRREIFI